MLNKDVVKFIRILKQDMENSGKTVIERAKDFICDLYCVYTVSNNRLLFELEYAFCEVLKYMDKQTISHFANRYFEMKKQCNADYEIYALTQSLRLLPVKNENGKYINGFCAENMED